MNIIPAILESDFNEIENKIEAVVGDTDKIHIDICDGLLVSKKTWPYSQSPNNRIEENYHVKKLLNEEEGLPYWQDLNYEFDLMIQNPGIQQDIWGRLGANIIIIHPKSFKDNEAIYDFIAEMNKYIIDIILAVTHEEYEEYKNLISDLIGGGFIKSLQVMTIKVIGSQGQKFDNRDFDLINKIKSDYPGLNIRVDGGVNEKNIDKLIDADIDECVIGSSVYASGNPRENLNYFKDLC